MGRTLKQNIQHYFFAGAAGAAVGVGAAPGAAGAPAAGS